MRVAAVMRIVFHINEVVEVPFHGLPGLEVECIGGIERHHEAKSTEAEACIEKVLATLYHIAGTEIAVDKGDAKSHAAIFLTHHRFARRFYGARIDVVGIVLLTIDFDSYFAIFFYHFHAVGVNDVDAVGVSLIVGLHACHHAQGGNQECNTSVHSSMKYDLLLIFIGVI